jgi:hypothetical protein
MRNCKTALVVANEDRRHALARRGGLTRRGPRQIVSTNQLNEGELEKLVDAGRRR